jgi:thermostable 8-oxoguanine DNA glycosylase
MYGHADGFIAPCLWGLKVKESAYLLYNEGCEDILIQSKYVTRDLVRRGGRIRLFGAITHKNGFKEMSVESFIELK